MTRNNVFWYSDIKFQLHNTTEKTKLIYVDIFLDGCSWQKYNQLNRSESILLQHLLYEICSEACLLLEVKKF